MTWKIEASRRCCCWALCLLGVGLSACGTEGSSPEWPRFTDRATASGLTEPVRAGDAQKADVLEANTGGVAIIDYDEDGDRDLFFVNGGARSPYDEEVPRSMLYRNDGRLQFTNVSEESGADVTAWGMGVAVWDVDGDGWPDMFLSAWGANHLFLNQRDGTFGSVPSAGGASDDGWSTGIAAADYDLDGDVDVYVAQICGPPCGTGGDPFLYVARDPRILRTCRFAGGARQAIRTDLVWPLDLSGCHRGGRDLRTDSGLWAWGGGRRSGCQRGSRSLCGQRRDAEFPL